jgi:hypothetical protein
MFPLLLSATVLLPGGRAARGGDVGTCYVATIREPFIIGDGEVHPAGRLRICESARLSPVETLHVIYVDGLPEGAFRFRDAGASDRELAEGAAVFLFRRAGGVMQLAGLSWCRGASEQTVAIVRGSLDPAAPATVVAATVMAAR